MSNLIPLQLDRDTGNIVAQNLASNSSGTVTSVATVGSTGLAVSGSPVTSSGTLTFTLNVELQGISGLSINGFVQRTGAGTYIASNLTNSQIITALGFTPYNAINPSNYISGPITSGTITTALGFTPYNAINPSGYIAVAVTSAIAGSGIAVSSSTGAVTFSNTGVLSFNGRTGTVTLQSADVTNALGFTPGSSTATVTSVSVVTANGISGSVATSTTTPAITLTLGAITPTSVVSTGTIAASNFSGSSSGTNTGDQNVPNAIIKTANYTALPNDMIIVDTSGGAVTITLPTAPTFGQIVKFIDGAGTWNANNLTVNGNGSNILGNSTTLVVDLARENFTLIYYNVTQGWILGT